MIIEISVAVIAAFIVIFVIGLLVVFVQIKRTAKEAEKFLETSRQHIVPLSHDITIILNNSKKIIQSLERQVGKIEGGVDALKDTAEKVKQFEADFEKRIEQPLLEITSFIAAFTKVLRSVLGYFGKTHQKGEM